MKKVLLSSALLLTLVVAGCENNEEDTNQPMNEETSSQTEPTQNTEVDESDKERPEQQVGDTIESEGGEKHVVGTSYGINETQTSGPIELTVNGAQLGQLKPAPDLVDMFGGEDLAMVAIDITVENTVAETTNIYPDQATIVTDNGNQVDAEVFLSDQVGGEFLGEVTKEGQVFFIWDGNSADVNSLRYIIAAPSDNDFNSLGEDLEFQITFDK